MKQPSVSIDTPRMSQLKSLIGNSLYDAVLDFFVEEARVVEQDLAEAIEHRNMHKIVVTCEHFRSLCTLVGAIELNEATKEIEKQANQSLGRVSKRSFEFWQHLLMNVFSIIRPSKQREHHSHTSSSHASDTSMTVGNAALHQIES